MPLNWSTKKCNPPLPVDDRDGHWSVKLIEATMGLGIHSITEKNIEEWLWRAAFVKRLGLGNLDTQYADEVVPLTAAILRRWIGLSTNASDFTRAKFKKECMEQVERNVAAQVRRAMEVKE
jgi:hypothetical protein